MRASRIVAGIVAALVLAVLLTGGGLEPGVPAQAQSTPSRPNIVLLMADDLRVDDLQRMPITRRLVGAAGTSFSRSYVSFPLCCPSRATLNSGQYSQNNGVRGNVPPVGGFQALRGRGTLLASWLQDAGYHTSHIGKYLNGYAGKAAVPQPGWDEWRGSVDPSTYLMWGYTMVENGRHVTYGDPAQEDPALYQTDVWRDKAEAYIRARAAAAQPFYLDVAFLAPHRESARAGVEQDSSLRSAPRHRGRMANARLPRSPAFDEASFADKPAWLRETARRLRPGQIARITREHRTRQESLLALDEAVGRIVAVLEETRQLANTYVVFTSDNGFFLGEHRIPNGKTLAYEPSARVPLLIRGPGIRPGGRSRELVANVDLAPTFADIAGATPTRTVDGRSLLPYARDPRRTSDRPLLIESGPGRPTSDLDQDSGRNPPQALGSQVRAPAYRAIRAGSYKYVEHKDGSRELYDLARDPHELTSRHDDRRYRAVRRALARGLESLAACRGAACRRPLGRASRQTAAP